MSNMFDDVLIMGSFEESIKEIEKWKNYYEKRLKSQSETINDLTNRLSDKDFENSEIKKLQEINNNLTKEIERGFSISEEEKKEI